MKHSLRHSLLFIGCGAIISLAAFTSSSAMAQDTTLAMPTPTDSPSPTAANTVSLGLTQNAETVPKVAPEVLILRRIEKEMKEKRGKEVYVRSSVPSLVFTPAQYALLREARIGFNTRLPSLAELRQGGDPNDPNYRGAVSIRNVKLGGIVFSTPDDWTIWLNNARVTPDALPSQAIDLRVYKDFIELKWFDAQTNQIFPIRLRANQTFNLDARFFLPG